MQNAIPNDVASSGLGGVAARIAQQTVSAREAVYADEVRRILDAAVDLMRSCGTASKPRVADIVAAAGLSNEAFYRHFKSKDALVAAILEDGTEQLGSYLAHQMAKEPRPAAKVGRWVRGVLSQANPDIAATTRAVLWNGSGISTAPAPGRHPSSAYLSPLLVEPLRELGSDHPELDSTLTAHAVFGKLSDYLWQETQPANEEVEAIIDYCLGAVTRAHPSNAAGRPTMEAPG